MELPQPIVPGWYSTEQIREMLGLKTRAGVSFRAKSEGWGFTKIAQSKLYDAEDVKKYLIATGKIQPPSDIDTPQQ